MIYEKKGEEYDEEEERLESFDEFKTRTCCYEKTVFHNYEIVYDMINKLNIGKNEKKMILWRIQRIYKKVLGLQKIYKYCYFNSKVFVMVASILSPALTSINTDEKKSVYVYLWWITWTLQIIISLLTSISTFFKWDRNYFLYNEYKDRIEEEVWHYLECTNQYKIDSSDNSFEDMHEMNIPLFLQNLEHQYSKLCIKDTEIKQTVAFTYEEPLHLQNVKKKHKELNNEAPAPPPPPPKSR